MLIPYQELGLGAGLGLGTVSTDGPVAVAVSDSLTDLAPGCYDPANTYIVAPTCADGSLMPACGSGRVCGGPVVPLEPITGQAFARYAPWVVGGVVAVLFLRGK